MQPLRPLHPHEAAILARLQAGQTEAELTAGLASDIGGPGRVAYCLVELRGLGLYTIGPSGHGALTERGRKTCSGKPTTPTPKPRRKKPRTTEPPPGPQGDDSGEAPTIGD